MNQPARERHAGTLRILLVSQMYPGPDDPDLGCFVEQIVGQLEGQGHEVARVVINQRGLPKTKYLKLAWQAVRQARKFKPDVIYAHFLVPAGLCAALASKLSGVPLVLTAHGTDVANIGTVKGIRTATRIAARRACAVIAVSDYLRHKLIAEFPDIERQTTTIDCGVDLTRFFGTDPTAAREALEWSGEPPFYLFVGSLAERKNVLRLVEAFERLGAGQLAIVGEGPLRSEIREQPRLRLVGQIRPDQVPDWITAADVLCQPSLIEPFGQALMEAMASERTVVATEVGGPPEFVTPESGVLVDPGSVDSIEAGLRAAAELPTPNLAARKVAERHDVRLQAERIAEVLRRCAA